MAKPSVDEGEANSAWPDDAELYDGPMPGPIPPAEIASRRLQVVSTVLLVTFCVVVGIITFWPGPPDPDGQHALKSFLLTAHAHGLPMWISFDLIEFIANVLMFVPIGLFGALALARARWLILLAAVSASVTIEIIQATRMPERVGTPRDVIANGLGAVIGYLLARVVVARGRARGGRRGRHAQSATPPTIPAGSLTAGPVTAES
jgi:VanZ like family